MLLQRSDLNTPARPAGFYHYTVQVGTEGDGTHDTFIPVWWWGSPSSWGHRTIIISRNYASTGPSVHGSHKAGLQFEMVCGNNDWGGHPHTLTVTAHYYQYRQTVGEAGGTAHNMKNYVKLRGGGYVYNFTVFGAGIDIQVGTTGTNTTYGTPTTLSSQTNTNLATKVYT